MCWVIAALDDELRPGRELEAEERHDGVDVAAVAVRGDRCFRFGEPAIAEAGEVVLDRTAAGVLEVAPERPVR